MAFLDSILGNLAGGALGGVQDLLKDQGGVPGLIAKFSQNGLGDVVASWVGRGANLGITPEQITAVLGSGPVAAFAEKLGVSPDQASATLSAVLPQLIDQLTPDGEVPAAGAGGLGADLLNNLPGGLGDLAGGVLGGLFKK